MLSDPMDVLQQFPVRKSKKQKQAFRDAVQAYALGLGYPVNVEKGSMGAQNVVIGNANTARYLVTAHYDTPARMFFPNFITPCNFLIYLLYQLVLTAVIMFLPMIPAVIAGVYLGTDMAFFLWYLGFWGTLLMMMFGPGNKHNANDNTSGVVTLLEIVKTMPQAHRNKVAFVLFDLEEAGLVGSAAYRKTHKKQTDHQVILNLDCVGDGDEIVMFPTSKLNKDANTMTSLDSISRYCGEKRLYLHKKGFALCPSDQANFPKAVGIMAFRRAKGIGLYCNRIHTNRDTILEQTNVNILRAAITSLICQ